MKEVKDRYAFENNDSKVYKLDYLGNSEEIFGKNDAKIDCLDNQEFHNKLFVPIASYKVFIEYNSLFIYGRKGTGKTAMIKMLDYEVKNSITKAYHYSKIISQEDQTFDKLAIELRAVQNLYERTELAHVLIKKLSWVINTTAMISVLESNMSRYMKDVDLLFVARYLVDENLFQFDEKKKKISKPYENASKKFTKQLKAFSQDLLNENNTANLNEAFNKIELELFKQNYRSAFEALTRFLKKNNEKCIVLIDSKEKYNFSDNLTERIASSFIDAVYEIHNESNKTNIFAKIANPSEVMDNFDPIYIAKINDKRHFIFWRYKDILSFIAKRYCKLLKENNYVLEHNCENMSGNNQDFLDQFLPKKTISFGNMEFDTIPYILSHTQKKPREVIMLFNQILTLARQNSIPFNKLTSLCIKEGTNINIENLSGPHLELYKALYPEALNIVRKTFSHSKNILKYGELMRQMRECKSIIAKVQKKYDVELDNDKLERLFLSSGIIGIIQTEYKSNEKNLFEAIYEYQIKGTLSLTSSSMIAIHPMFYQAYQILVDSNSLIYPKPSIDEQDELQLLSNWFANGN